MIRIFLVMIFGMCCFLLGDMKLNLKSKKCDFVDGILLSAGVVFGLASFIGLMFL